MLRRRNLVLAALAVTACDIPTSVPMWEQTWMVPGDSVRVHVGDLLPAGVALSADSTAFEAVVPGTEIVLSLGEMCPECAALNGTMAPKPAFTDTVSTTMTLPAELLSAQTAGGEIALTLAHNLGFDPLRPSSDPAAPRGEMVVELTSAGNVVAADTLHGADVAFDSTQVLTPLLQIRDTQVDNVLDLRVIVYSPAGDSVEIDTSDTLGIRVQGGPVALSQATIEAGELVLDGTETTLQLGATDSATVSRIQSGAIIFDVSNPFTLQGTLDMQFDLGGEVIQRSLTLAPGEYRARIQFTGDELRRMMGAADVVVRTSGVLASPDGTLTISPDQELLMESNLEIVVLVGGQEEGA